jgi:hypothetical protein
MPPLNRFVADGILQTGNLVRWAALRPQYWPAMISLGINSRRASKSLCDWLRSHLAGNLQAAKVVTLNGEYSKS